MAPRKQTKQTAESVKIADANVDVTPPKKRKNAATVTKAIFEEPKQAKTPRTRLQRAKVEKQKANENQVMNNDVSPPKKPRVSKAKNAPTLPKTTTKNKPSKTEKTEETMQNNDAGEQISAEQVVVKKARTRTGVAAKKAGMKEQVVTKVKSKASPAKKPAKKIAMTVVTGNNVASEDTDKKAVERIPAKKTRAKPIEKNVIPATETISTRALRKRKSAENMNNSNITEDADAQISEQKKVVADKKPRIRAKKTDDEPKVIKGKAKKTTAKAKIVNPSLEEAEIEEQNYYNTIIEESNAKKIKNTKTAKKTPKITNPQRKHNVLMEKINGIQAENAVMSEAEANGNGESETTQAKQKRKDTAKANRATEKTEEKGKQKKGQTVTKPIVEKETENATEKDDTNDEKVNAAEVLIKNSTGVLLNKGNNIVKNVEENDEKNESFELLELDKSLNNTVFLNTETDISTEEKN